MQEWRQLVSIVWMMICVSIVGAQDAATPPDVRGQPVPVARATLNAAGFSLGTVTPVEWSAEAGDKNTVASQVMADDDSTGVDVTVLRDFNVELRYRGNVFHMINNAGVPLTLSQVRFVRLGADEAAVQGTRWGATLRTDQCVQIWATQINNFVKPEGCLYVQGNGFVTSQAVRDFFWRGEAAQFAVLQDGIQRGTCETVTADADAFTSCEVYLAPGTVPSDTTEAAYFVYDDHDWYAVNQSPDQWFTLGQVQLEIPVDIVNDRFYDTDPLDDVAQLAPGQCVRLNDGTDRPIDEPPLVDCAVIATATMSDNAVFWRDGFTLTSVVLDDDRRCPRVPDNLRTLCLLPR